MVDTGLNRAEQLEPGLIAYARGTIVLTQLVQLDERLFRSDHFAIFRAPRSCMVVSLRLFFSLVCRQKIVCHTSAFLLSFG